MVDTAGTLCAGAQAIVDNGATDVYAMCVHGILSGPAMERIEESVLTKLIITDSIQQNEELLSSKIDVVSIDDLLAMAIENVYNGRSITHIFGAS